MNKQDLLGRVMMSVATILVGVAHRRGFECHACAQPNLERARAAS